MADDSETETALEGGNYEVVRARLVAQAKELGARIDRLNERRREVFGGTELEVVANERVRTENNCVPRDIVNVGGQLLFGYNVFLGLKKETTVGDILSVHRFAETADGYDLGEVPALEVDFLADEGFRKELTTLYSYFKEARLLQLRKTDTRLLAVFQIGASTSEIRVFRWRIDPSGRVTFMDARGEGDHVFPKAYDFEWVPVTRNDQVQGRYPHLSILDEIFVETTGGDLTIKVENNTETGRGIYAEPVDDPNQALDDAQVRYAKVGSLILLEILPFREQRKRYFVYNGRIQRVTRIDAIGTACRSLPEDQGILFPGGFYLETGEQKIFDEDVAGLELKRVIQSPNGEDMLYVFHRRDEGLYQLLPYNVIRKELQTPIRAHGFSLFDDGKMVVFRATEEPTRVHPMQIWRTPFTSAEYAAKAPTNGSFLAKVGNADLVRGVSDCFTIRRLIERAEPSRANYEVLIKTITRTLDAYYWLGHEEVGALDASLTELRRTAELIVDEFEKLLALRQRAAAELDVAKAKQAEILANVRAAELSSVEGFMRALTQLRHQRGALITLKEVRYVDLEAADALEAEIVEQFDRVSRACVSFLLGDDALVPIRGRLEAILARVDECRTVAEMAPLGAELDETGEGLDVISEIVQGLDVDDATARTQILEGISEVYALLNRVRASAVARRRELASQEGRAEFGAQFKLLAQAVSSGLALAETPERCDEQLSRLMVQLEELEARFSELDEFTADLAVKREEIYEAFSTKKQALLDARQRRAEGLMDAASRILEGVGRRARTFKAPDELHAYFASDPMVTKLRQIGAQLRELGDSVKSDEVDARMKSARQDALRALRDQVDLFEEGDLIRLGKHRFSVNTQPLELTMVPRGDRMAIHLTGTDFYELVDDPELEATRPYWSQELVSETPTVYRAEYLATGILFDAEENRDGLTIEALHEAQRTEGGLAEVVRRVASTRYDEGYDRGVHDADATLILEKLLTLRDSAGLLRYAATPRALACLFWAHAPSPMDVARGASTLDSRPRGAPDDGMKTDAARGIRIDRDALHRRARSLGRLRHAFGHTDELAAFGQELAAHIRSFHTAHGIPCTEGEARLAGRYLVEELMVERPRFATSADATQLRDALLRRLDLDGTRRAFEEDLEASGGGLRARLALVHAWLDAFVRRSDRDAASPVTSAARGPVASHGVAHLAHASFEAAALLLTPSLDREPSSALTRAEVEGLLGQHPRIQGRTMSLRLDETLERLSEFVHHRVPGYRSYREVRHGFLERQRVRLRLDEYKPQVMSAFVRNRLINEVYLPIIGDNLAKQLGAAGAGRRTDLMGLLLLVSPPGYGKTTLMEYVANRLGMVFMKVNGPSLGHSVTSLDPEEAPNATARQEVEKINLAFEMAQNVMLYLDDIQHTHPELLQKFISLCDGTRRVEGVWKGRTRTYDLRGKKFCVVMAGNPYTESGEKFQIPDMLANRADTYNLGDILEGREEVFALSYIENALTSSPALAPLATRDQGDVYKVVRMAKGEEVATSELSYGYAAGELEEMKTVLRHLFRVQDVLLRVNAEYIRSASQADAFRTEPPFKLQGSYRNMNKLAEKVVAAMNDDEVERLVDDHYLGESQTLTTGAEQNLLKLADLRGRLAPEQAERWTQIKREFVRLRSQGGGDDDPVTRLTGTLSGLGRELESIRDTILTAAERAAAARAASELAAERSAVDRARATHDTNGDALLAALGPKLDQLGEALARLASPKVEVKLEAPSPGPLTSRELGATADQLAAQAELFERTLLPMVQSTTRNLDDTKSLHDHIIQLLDLVRRMDTKLRETYGL
ncbi:MAG: DNA repair ATPase [Myxococcales bacterium]|nr:DNA repair ATPase [Myxococcales bacterium]